MNKNGKEVACPICGTATYFRLARLKRGGKFCSKECFDKSKRGNTPPNIEIARSKSPIKKGNKLASLNVGTRHWAWQGDFPSYRAVHAWLKKTYGNAQKCESCGSTKQVQWANISGKYKRDRNDFKQLCPSCHKLFDLKKV